MTPTRYGEKQQYFSDGNYYNCQASYRFNTRTYDSLRPFREMTNRDLLLSLNEYSFSIWMLDDGHCNEDGGWDLCCPLKTQEDRDYLTAILKDKFNLIARQQKDDRYFRFHIDDSIKITDIIMKNIPHNLDIIKYKILSKPKYQHYMEVD